MHAAHGRKIISGVAWATRRTSGPCACVFGRQWSPSSLRTMTADAPGTHYEKDSAPNVPLPFGTHLDARTNRSKILSRLNAVVKSGMPIIGAGAGTGLSAKCEEAGGVDLIVIYNSGRFRMAGRGSLAGLMPYADANAVVMDMAREVLPVVSRVPVLAGVCGTDPFRDMDRFLKEVRDAGFAGVQNFPTVGLIDGVFRQNLEETGMGFDLEVEMIRKASNMGLLTTPYAFDASQAGKLAYAGADVIVGHVGLTTSGSIGAKTSLTLQQSAALIQEISNAARHVNPDVLVLCHGGPIADPEDAQYVMSHTVGGSVNGFYGASSFERLPVEKAIKSCVLGFKSIRLTKS